MRKRYFAILVALVAILVTSAGAFAAEADYSEFSGAVTGFLTDLSAVAITVLGAALVLGGGIVIIRIGFRWAKGFLAGRS